MKTIDLSNVQAGVRGLAAVKQLFNHMQEAYKECLDDIMQGLVGSSASYVVLKGCVNTGVLPNYNISAGVILKDGELYRVAAFVGLAVGADVPRLKAVTTNTPLEYTDGSTINTLVTRTYEWELGPAGGGLVDFGNLVSIASAIGSILTTKANKTPSAWVDIALAAGWSSDSYPAQYRIDEFGMVHLRGSIYTNTATENNTWAAAGVLPAMRAGLEATFTKPYLLGIGGNYQELCYIRILDDGRGLVNKKPADWGAGAVDARFDLHGISYWPGNA